MVSQTKANVSLRIGDRVRIVSGVYRKHGEATYLGPAGTTRCTIRIRPIDGFFDRDVCLDSIERIEAALPEDTKSSTATKPIKISEVRKDLRAIKTMIECIEQKLDHLGG